MRVWLSHAAVFVCVFCGFVGYCRICEMLQPASVEAAQVPPDVGGFLVSGAADESFDGEYIPVQVGGIKCWQKTTMPDRYLWYGGRRWHLSRSPGRCADGYMTCRGGSFHDRWVVDGAPAPSPKVTTLPECPEEPLVASR